MSAIYYGPQIQSCEQSTLDTELASRGPACHSSCVSNSGLGVAQKRNRADHPPASRVDQILDRRKQLKRQRQSQQFKTGWRTLITLAITLSLGWAISRPDWKLRQPEQVTIVGNQQIATQAIAKLLPLSYPISLIRLDPQQISTALKDHAHLETVVVSRRLFPPRIQVAVQERPPVAITICDRCTLQLNPNTPNSLQIGPANVWLIDAQGIALPIYTYPQLETSQKNLPNLTLDNYFSPLPTTEAAASQTEARPENVTPMTLDQAKQNAWQTAYPILQNSTTLDPKSPVHLSRMDWKNTEKLSAQTKLGTVHFGRFSDALPEQLNALNKLRDLKTQIDLEEIVHIDLQNPQKPDLKMRQPPSPASPPSP